MMYHILFEIFKITLNVLKNEAITDNPSVMIYVNKIKHGITFKIQAGYYLNLSIL